MLNEHDMENREEYKRGFEIIIDIFLRQFGFVCRILYAF